MFEKCISCGYEALIIKCADLLDNINYVNLAENLEKKENLLKKYQLFLTMTEKLIGEEKIYKLLENKYKTIIATK